MMFILMLTRYWHTASGNLQRGVCFKPFGRSLEGLRLGIIGFGSSGQELARRAKGFGLKVEAIDIVRPEDKVLDELGVEFFAGPEKIDEVIGRCDFVSLHLHLTDETRGLIDARRIGMMKRNACIINVARGGLVDEEAMHKALLEGKLGGAGLDVFTQEPPDLSQEVYQLPNVVLTPHIAGVTDATARGRASVALENVNRIAEGKEPLYRVDE
jgi:D-3-phosphoglycerate dehydrogenase